MDAIEQQVEQQLYAAEMEPGKIYFTAQSNIKVKLKGTFDDNHVMLLALMPNTGEWRAVKVENKYAVRPPRKDEITMTEETSVAETSKPKPAPKHLGKVSGLKMLAAWGHYFEKLGAQENGRQLIIDAMIADFPEKVDSINKWVDAYRGYYNTGRLPGVSAPAEKIQWLSAVAVEKKQAKAQAALERTAKKAEKLAAKEKAAQERVAKKAAREAARAEKAAALEAKKAEARARKEAEKEAANTPAA